MLAVLMLFRGSVILRSVNSVSFCFIERTGLSIGPRPISKNSFHQTRSFSGGKWIKGENGFVEEIAGYADVAQDQKYCPDRRCDNRIRRRG